CLAHLSTKLPWLPWSIATNERSAPRPQKLGVQSGRAARRAGQHTEQLACFQGVRERARTTNAVDWSSRPGADQLDQDMGRARCRMAGWTRERRRLSSDKFFGGRHGTGVTCRRSKIVYEVCGG